MIPKTLPAFTVVEFLLGHPPEARFWETATEIIIDNWVDTDQQPTDQEIIDASNDLTTVNGQLFSEWYAEHGGDHVATMRRKAKDALDDQNRETNALIRALALVILDEINALRTHAAIGLTARTAAQVRTAIKGKITAGDADS